MENKLEQFWSPIAHQHAVVNSKELRKCYQQCLPKLSAYESAIGQNTQLYQAIKSLDKEALDSVQKKIVTDLLQDLELSGVALTSEKKVRFEAIQARLSELANLFENNILDAVQAFELRITDEALLTGVPEHARATAAFLAQKKQEQGWILTLDAPCYLAVITYCDNRELREILYKAYVTRASDEGPNAGQYDNSALIDEILCLRNEQAQLVGFNNYAESSLQQKMANSCVEVIDFLNKLAACSYTHAKNEYNNLAAFAKQECNLSPIEPWDVAYLSEKLCQRTHTISQEELRVYFPVAKVKEGLFTIINKLYGITLSPVKSAEAWHQDVLCYRLDDEKNETRGFVYMDIFARPNKRGGAWMDSLQSRRKRHDGSIQLPIATLTCNFAKTDSSEKALLSHDEMTTLFHEFGHCLHHLLTKVDYLSAAGINGVEWDAVELPSQIFENWCWEYQAISLLSAHPETQQPLEKVIFDNLLNAKNFQSAMAMMRQLEFSLFDFIVHKDFKRDKNFVADTLNTIRAQCTVTPIAAYNRFQHSFSHIFAGGYAAGYYSYKWAEVLSSDAYARFEEEGVFNPITGRSFLETILEVGSSLPAADAYKNFRGRPATIDALLKHNGIAV